MSVFSTLEERRVFKDTFFFLFGQHLHFLGRNDQNYLTKTCINQLSILEIFYALRRIFH